MSHAQRLVRASVVVELDPIADHPASRAAGFRSGGGARTAPDLPPLLRKAGCMNVEIQALTSVGSRLRGNDDNYSDLP